MHSKNQDAEQAAKEEPSGLSWLLGYKELYVTGRAFLLQDDIINFCLVMAVPLDCFYSSFPASLTA